jgi:hypothetical protein
MILPFYSPLYSQKWEAQVILNFRDEHLMSVSSTNQQITKEID